MGPYLTATLFPLTIIKFVKVRAYLHELLKSDNQSIKLLKTLAGI